MILVLDNNTTSPYARGYAHAMASAGSIRFPSTSDGWDYKLFHAGWSKGMDDKLSKRNQNDKNKYPINQPVT